MARPVGFGLPNARALEAMRALLSIDQRMRNQQRAPIEQRDAPNGFDTATLALLGLPEDALDRMSRIRNADPVRCAALLIVKLRFADFVWSDDKVVQARHARNLANAWRREQHKPHDLREARALWRRLQRTAKTSIQDERWLRLQLQRLYFTDCMAHMNRTMAVLLVAAKDRQFDVWFAMVRKASKPY